MAHEVPCPQCGEPNAADARFCDQCGSVLARPEAPSTGTASDTAAEPARRGRPSQLRIALIGLTVAVVLAGASFGAWWAIANRPVEVTEAASTSDPTPTASATASATAQAEAAPALAPVDFKSESGNIRCTIGTFDGQNAAICQQVNTNYAPPAGACAAGAPGVIVGVGESGAYWPCVATSIESANPIAYDTPVSQGGITCSINFNTGVRCVNERGQGFTMEYDAGVQTF